MAGVDRPRSLLGLWVEGNNDLVDEWKRVQISSHHQHHSKLKSCSSDFHKLLRLIQGVPPTVDLAPLELTVVYNLCSFSIAQSQMTQAEPLLTGAVHRALRVMGKDADTSSDGAVFWRAALNAFCDTPLCICTLRLLCLQWAIWLSTHRLKHIQDLKEELSSLSGRLCDLEDEQRKRSLAPQTPRLAAEPTQVAELLDICTILTQGAECLSDGRHSEALSEVQRGFSLRAPRNLLANAHILSGLCLANMGRPQMALQCYTRALETEPCCVPALHHSIRLYSLLGNTQAEMEGLRLLNTVGDAHRLSCCPRPQTPKWTLRPFL